MHAVATHPIAMQPFRVAPPDWAFLAALALPLLGALVLGWLTRRALLALARRARAHADGHLRARIAQVIAVPAAVAVPLAVLWMAVAATPLPSAWVARLQHGLGIGLLACLAWLAVRAVRATERRIIVDHPLDTDDNLDARRVQTQTRVISGVAQGLAILVCASLALMTFPAIRQIGTTLLASAGVLGLVAGIAAKPVFGNLIAGLQIALTQPIRLDDVVIVQGEWGRVEEITSAYVVVRIWDERRMVVPLQWFIENPFENWTRTTSQLLGSALLWLDYRVPMEPMREALQRICDSDPRWDGRVCVVQIVDAGESSVQVRLLVSARNSGDLFDLRCTVRERMIAYLDATCPQALPRLRIETGREPGQDLARAARAQERIDDQHSAAGGARSPGAEDDIGGNDGEGPEANDVTRGGPGQGP